MGNVIIVLGIVLLTVLMESWRENHVFRTTYYNIQSSKLQKLKRKRKVVVLSDLHNQCYGKNNQKLLTAIRRENPDLILIAGDMLIGKEGVSPKPAKEFVSALPAICDVYYANGNHEQRMKENTEKYGETYAVYQEQLKRAGIHFLENEGVRLSWDGQAVASIL